MAQGTTLAKSEAGTATLSCEPETPFLHGDGHIGRGHSHSNIGGALNIRPELRIRGQRILKQGQKMTRLDVLENCYWHKIKTGSSPERFKLNFGAYPIPAPFCRSWPRHSQPLRHMRSLR
jgi:hypothetical protein